MTDIKYMQPQFNIQINGQDAPASVIHALMQANVEQGLHLPALCQMRLQDDDLELANGSTFDIGYSLQVAMGNSNDLKRVFDGEITGIELMPTASGIHTLVIRAYDRLHRLQRGRQTRSFTQVTDSDLVRQIAQEAGLRHNVENTAEVFEYILQDNQTNYQFLRERTERIGCTFWVREGCLYFRKPTLKSPAPISLEWGSDLNYFHPTLSAKNQVDEVIVRGWDPEQKQPVIGRAVRGEKFAETEAKQSGTQVANRAFGGAQLVINRPVNTLAEAHAFARALFDDLEGAYIQAEGQTIGVPDLTPGSVIEIMNLGKRFSGKYFISKCTHHIDNKKGYHTDFTASGSRGYIMVDMILPVEHAQEMCIGVVTNNRDPKNMGRVKVQFPWLGDQVESTWARIASPMAGNGMGIYCLPEVNNEVLVAFEQGDINRAFIVGGLWNGRDKPPAHQSSVTDESGNVVQRVIKSRSGHTILLDDTSNREKIEITEKSGARIILKKAGAEVMKGNQTLRITEKSINLNNGALEVT